MVNKIICFRCKKEITESMYFAVSRFTDHPSKKAVHIGCSKPDDEWVKIFCKRFAQYQ